MFNWEIICQKNNGWAYVINPDKYDKVGTHWMAIYTDNDKVTYLNSCGVQNIPEEITKFKGNNNVKANLYKIQRHDLIMRVCYCIGLIGFMLNNKSLTDFTSQFWPYDFNIFHLHNTV